MFNRKKIVGLFLCLVLIGSLAIGTVGCSEDEPEVVWKLSTFTLPGATRTGIYEDFADLVNEKSDGRMEIKIYTSGELYEGMEMFDAVSSGAVDLASCPTTFYSEKMIKTMALLSQPFTSDTREAVAISEALTEEMNAIEVEAASHDVIHILRMYAGGIEFYFKEAVTKFEDVAGMTVSCPTGVGVPVAQVFGATAVPHDIVDIYMAAQTGAVDGRLILPIEDYAANQLYEVLPYAVISGVFHMPFTTLMNRTSYEALPEDLQDIVMEASDEAQAAGITATLEEEQETLDTLEDAGVDVYVLPEAEAAKWRSMIQLVFDGMIGQLLSADEIAESQQIVAAAMADYQASL